MEEELWLLAAQKVLELAKKPLHYTEIKRIILERGLLNPAMKTTLEEALFKEIQKAERRFQSIAGQPGVFGLVEGVKVKEEPVAEVVPKPQVTTTVNIQSRRVVKVRPPNPSMSAILQERYRLKYKRLRKQVKDLIFINSAVCDEVISIEDKIQKVKDERRYLLARLLQNRTVADSLLPPPPITTTSPSGSTSKHTTQSIAQILGEVDRRKRKVQPGVTAAGVKKKSATKDGGEERPKPKKARTGSSGRRLVQPLPLDNLGRPMLPFELGNLTVYCIGEIVSDRSGFHSSDCIFPAGYCSTREYVSIRNPLERCLYTCKIVDTGTGPKFDISPEDAPEIVFSGHSASECHLKLLKAINQGRTPELVPLTPRGEDFFGLSHSTVQNLIQSCPGAKKCANYRWIRFEISKQPLPDSQDLEDPVLSVEALHKLPTFASLVKAPPQPTAASLRTLLTTPEPS